MKPYFQEGDITIFHADCREVLPHVGRFDLCLTDPPYGIGRSGQARSICENSKHDHKFYEDLGWDGERPDALCFTYMREVAVNQIIWGGNYFADLLPASMGWLFWDKGQELSQADGELAWTSFNKAMRRKVLNRVAIDQDGAVHPTQKPVKIMLWSLAYAGNPQSVIDPFLGSGTTLVACKKLGIRGVGIEKEEKYAEIAVKRILNTTPSLFSEER